MPPQDITGEAYTPEGSEVADVTRRAVEGPVRAGAASGHGHAIEPPHPPKGGIPHTARWPTSRRPIFSCCFGRYLRSLAACPPPRPPRAPPAGAPTGTPAPAPLRGLAYGSLRAFCAPGSPATPSAAGVVFVASGVPLPRFVLWLPARPTRAQPGPPFGLGLGLREVGQRGPTKAEGAGRSPCFRAASSAGTKPPTARQPRTARTPKKFC